MTNRQYIEALAKIHERAVESFRALAASSDADDRKAWLPQAEEILETVETAISELPAEVNG